jgi:hypothetical protein
MQEIRKDIFPRMKPLFQRREAVIEDYINEAFEAVSSLFPTREDVIEYINSLDSPETAELFIRICQYYLISKKYQTSSYVKLIMIISAIERLISKDRKYEEFYQWIIKQDNIIEAELKKTENVNKAIFKKIVETLAEEYFKIFSSRRNIIDFFQSHLSKENKVKLIRSFRGYWTNVIQAFSGRVYKNALHPFPSTIKEVGKKLHKNVETHLMPYCYDWRYCWVQYGECFPDIYCEIANEDQKLKKFLKKVVSDLYQMRNDFVHSARVMPLNEKDAVGTLNVLGADRKPVSIELTAEELEAIFESGLKHYFDRFVR